MARGQPRGAPSDSAIGYRIANLVTQKKTRDSYRLECEVNTKSTAHDSPNNCKKTRNIDGGKNEHGTKERSIPAGIAGERTVKDNSRERRAIALAWLFHLVCDIHQPLHTAQLFTVEYPHGDRGGNQICIRVTHVGQPMPLHRFWDGVITSTGDIIRLRNAATEMRNRPGFAKSQLTELGSTDADTWAKESFEIATKIAHQNGRLTGSPRDGNRDCTMVAVAPVLPVGYVVGARRIADRRMILTGYRLADLLTRVVGG